MADQMDVDADPLSGEIFPPIDRKRTLRSGSATTTAKEEDPSELPQLKQEALSATLDMDRSGRSSGQTPIKKQRMNMIQQIPQFIGLTSWQRNKQRGSDKIDADRLRGLLQVSQAETIALKKTIKDLRAKIDPVQETNQRLDQWVRRGKKEYGNLLDKNNALEQNLEEEKKDRRKENAQLHARINDLTRTNDRLRQMIVPISEKQVLDSDVVSRFISLRASILSLVRQTWKLQLKKNVDFKQLSGRQRDFFTSPFTLSYERLRYVVFKAIDDIILGSGRYFLREDLEPLEQQIRKVEKGLDENLSVEGCGTTIEWRNATFKATQSLRQTHNRFSSATTNKLWKLLAPLQTKSAESENTGRAKLEAICDKAVELSLILRQLQDCFWVDNLESAVGRHISGCGHVADDIESVVADTGLPTGTIAYVITGALIKRPKEDFKRILVLEKGEVAVVE